MKTKKRSITKSNKWWARAEKLIPCGTQTLSKGPTQFVEGIAPKYLKSGKGCHVFDVDGNEYIDYLMGLMPIILGYSYPRVDNAIKKQLEGGITFSLMHPLEVELAELLVECIPCAEMVRYGKNGSDVTSAAVRLARAYTRRDKIACCGYHGGQDWYVATTERNAGIPEAVKKLSLTFKYNDIESLKKLFEENKDDIAAVIMEPVGVIEPKDDFLDKVKKITHENGALLIFDEIITGFRWALGGAQEYFKVIPDLAAYGKGMGNGMPIAALVGKAEVMRKLEDVFFSFTFGGECLSLAASIATIKEIKEKNVIAHLWKQGRKVQNGLNKIAKEHGISKNVECIGYPPRSYVKFVDANDKDWWELKSLFQQEVIKRGILFGGYHAISFSHADEDIEKTLGAYDEAACTVRKALDEKNMKKYMEGEFVKPVFRSVGR